MPNLKKCTLAVLFALLAMYSKAQDLTYEVCLQQKDAINIGFNLKICNNTNTAINEFSILFDWPGFTGVTTDYGLDVVQNGSVNNQVELKNIQWGPTIPANGCQTFTIRGLHSQGMFVSGDGKLNGVQMENIPCYVPSAADNFSCEFELNKACGIHTGSLDKDTWDPVEGEFHIEEGEIRLGQGSVYAWNATNQNIYIPSNRYDWAVSAAVAHTLFTNLMGVDLMSINEYMATSKQEIDCGCDPGITSPAWVTAPYKIQPTNYCKDYSGGVAVGFFQQEKGTGWLELAADLPCIYGVSDFNTVAVDGDWGTQIINKVYHDYNNVRFWELVKGWDPINFFKTANDPYAIEKVISLAYNRGMNDGSIQNILSTNRAAAVASNDLLDQMFLGGVGFTYAEQISRLTAVLDNKLGAVSNLGTTTNGIPFPASHSFHSFFDEQITWADVETSIDQITAFYAATGLVNVPALKAKVKAVFDGINGGGTVGFRYEIAPVIDEIVFSLPAFDPAEGLANVYGNSGGNDVVYPTARLEGGDTLCPGSKLELTVYLTGQAPWEFTYLDNMGNQYVETGITVSPYVFSVPDTGYYWLETMSDGSGTDGSFKCDPETLAYSEKGGTADILTFGTSGGCDGDSLRIDLTGDAPWIVTYTDPAGDEQVLNLNAADTPYVFPMPVAKGDYILTELNSAGCIVELDDTANVKEGGLPPDATILTPDTSICQGDTAHIRIDFDGTAPFELKYTIAGLPQIHTTGITDTFYVVSVSTDVSVTVDSISDANCSSEVNSSITVTVNDLPIVDLGNDTSICDGQAPYGLDADNNGATYLWNDGTTNQTLNATASGEYDVIVTNAEGCEAKDTMELTINDSPVVDLGNDTTICSSNGNSVVFDAENNGSTYLWNDGTTGQTIDVDSTAIYWVIVTSNSCSDTDSVSLTVGGDIEVALGNDTSICDGSITLDAGATGDDYLWNDGSTNQTLLVDAAGDYEVYVSNASGCEGRDTISVGIATTPDVVLREDTTICAANGALLLDAGNTGSTFLWNTGEVTQTISVDSTSVYKVVVSNGACSDSDSVAITVAGSAVLDLGPDSAVCDSAVLLDAGTGFTDYLWDDASTLQTLSAQTSGEYFIEVVDNNGCIGRDTINIVINTSPVVDLGGDASICPTSPAVTFDAGNAGATYVWSSGETTQTISKGNADAGEYSVVVTVNGCVGSDTIELEVSTELKVDLGEDIEICTGTDTVLDAGFGVGYTFDWNNTGANTIQTFTSGDGEVVVLVADAGGCSGRDTIQITEINPLQISLGNDVAICENDNEVTFELVSGRTDLDLTTWNDGSNGTSISTDVAGLYWLEVDSAGCIAADTVELFVNALPIINLGADTFLCKGTNPNIILDAGDFVSYQWSDITMNVLLGNNQTQQVSDVRLYDVEVVDTNNCVNRDTIEVTEKLSTDFTLGADTTICPAGSATLNVPNNLQGVVGASWAWLNDASTGVDFTVDNQVDGNVVNVILAYSNEFGCISGDTLKITVDNTLPITALVDTAICEGEDISFLSGYTTTGYSFTWHDGSTDSQFDFTNVTNADAGNVQVDIVSDEGCSGSATATLVVNLNPIPSLTDGSICVGQKTILDHGLSNVKTLWTPTNDTTQSIEVTLAGTYSVVVTDIAGCTGSASADLVVNVPPVVSLGADQVLCDGETFALSTGFDDVDYSHQWNQSSTETVVSIDVTLGGDYGVVVTDIATGCSNGDTINFVFNDVPDLDLGDDVSICENETHTIISNETNPDYSYVWSTSETTTLIEVNTTNTYTLTVTNGSCEDQDDVLVTVHPLPISELMNDTILCFEDLPDGLNLDPGRVGVAFDWGNGETSQVINVNSSGVYVVTITSGENCSITDRVSIKQDCPASVWLPNTFTPNGNSVNDHWEIKGRGVESVQVLVYNRWGELIWEGNNIGESWNGTYKSREVQQDVYVYKLVYSYFDVNESLKSKTRTGTITVIR